MDYKKNYLDAYKQMKEAAIARLKKYGKTLDVHKTLKQMLMREKGYKTAKEIPDDVLDDYKWENTYSCVFEGKHEQLYCCNILKVRYNKKTDEVEVYLHDDEGYISEWFMESYVGWDRDSIWMTILDLIDGDEGDESNYVWAFTAEQAWDGEFADTIVHVFPTEEAAQKYMHDFLLYDGGDESIRDYVKRKEWEVEEDEPSLYRAYSPGYYATDHIEMTITKCNIEK